MFIIMKTKIISTIIGLCLVISALPMVSFADSGIYKAEFFVYIMPLILMISSYLIAYNLGAKESICVLCCFIALILSAVILVITQRNKKNIQFVIVKLEEN